MKKPETITLKPEEVKSLCEKISGSNLSGADSDLLIGLINANVWMQHELREGRITMRRMRKLFGVVTEKLKNFKPKDMPPVVPLSEDAALDEETKPKNHGRLPESAYTGAEDVDVFHPDLAPGDECPEVACGGILYEIKKAPVVIRIEGHPIANATRYKLQSLRCNVCQEFFTASLPSGVHPTEKYDAGVKSLLLINKYFTAVPFYRQDTLQDFLGIPFPASTQWDLIKSTVSVMKPIYLALFQLAANGVGFYVDDTHVKILTQIALNKKAVTQKEKKGSYTTGILSLHESHPIYLFISDTLAAGRTFDTLWSYRDPKLPPPFFMCDRLNANIPQKVEDSLYLLCHCLAHARRKFYELGSGYEELATTVLGAIGQVYNNENEIKKKQMSDEERLHYHKTHSLAGMNELKIYLEHYRMNHLAEPNGSAGKAIDYLLKRWNELTRFMEYPGVPLDTNILEQALKIPIRTRKNSMFYKTEFGAQVAGFALHILADVEQRFLLMWNTNSC